MKYKMATWCGQSSKYIKVGQVESRRERRTSLAGGDLDCRETAYLLVFFASFNTSSGAAEGF